MVRANDQDFMGIQNGFSIGEFHTLRTNCEKVITQNILDNLGDQNECCICLDGYQLDQKVIFFNKCPHKFHSKCIEQWLKKKAECPLCKQNKKDELEVNMEQETNTQTANISLTRAGENKISMIKDKFNFDGEKMNRSTFSDGANMNLDISQIQLSELMRGNKNGQYPSPDMRDKKVEIHQLKKNSDPIMGESTGFLKFSRSNSLKVAEGQKDSSNSRNPLQTEPDDSMYSPDGNLMTEKCNILMTEQSDFEDSQTSPEIKSKNYSQVDQENPINHTLEEGMFSTRDRNPDEGAPDFSKSSSVNERSSHTQGESSEY